VSVLEADARNGQRRVDVGLVGERWRDGVAIVRGERRLGVATLDRAEQAIKQLLARAGRCRDRSPEIERQIAVAERIDAGFDIVQRLVGRLLADDIHQTARPGAAIQNRRRPAKDVDTLDAEWREFPGREREALELHSVLKQADVLRVETANLEPVVARIGAEGLAADARRVPQRFAKLPGFWSRICSRLTTEIACGVSIRGVLVFVPVKERSAT